MSDLTPIQGLSVRAQVLTIRSMAIFYRTNKIDPSLADVLDSHADIISTLGDALAAERGRADRAEAALAEAWDEGYDASSTDWDNGGPGDPNPYRSEATA